VLATKLAAFLSLDFMLHIQCELGAIRNPLSGQIRWRSRNGFVTIDALIYSAVMIKGKWIRGKV
jgi:hypothetical protein